MSYESSRPSAFAPAGTHTLCALVLTRSKRPSSIPTPVVMGPRAMCAIAHSAGTTREGLASLAAVPQPRRNAVDGELDAAQHLFVGILCAMLLQEFHLHMVERIEIGKAVADRALQQRVALQQALLPHDVQ